MITAILMAAGYSRRFQTDKLMLPLQGKPLLAHTMEAISICPFSQKLLVYRNDAAVTLAEQYQFQYIENIHAEQGQSASLRLGVQHAAPDSALMFFTGDQPYLTPEIIKTLIETYHQNPHSIIIPELNGQNKSPTIFPSSFRDELLKITGDMGGRKVIMQHPQQIHKVPFIDELAFFDIDTPKNYETALEKTAGDIDRRVRRL